MAQTPPPQLVLAQAPQAQASGKLAKAHVRAVEAQPTAQPKQQPAPQPAVQARPTAQPPTAQPQARPATLSTGRYVKQDMNFVKQVISADSGEAFRAIRQRLERRFVKQA